MARRVARSTTKEVEQPQLVGHEKIMADLVRLATSGELSHGYIFYGPAMVGKRLAAVTLAQFLENGAAGGAAPRVLSDLLLIEPGENGSIGIDAAREAKHFLWQKPNVSSRRTLVIDDADLLTTEAQNALLKVTEEPPVSSLLILVTSDRAGVLPTITSRLPGIYFGSVAETKIAELVSAELAKKAMGKPGLAWRLKHDKELLNQLDLAQKLLKTPAATRRDLVKKIIEPETFSFRKFLDAVMIVLAWQGVSKAQASLWHKVLRLYDRETNFSLNPRLQMEALFV